jgi:hypothetical protein
MKNYLISIWFLAIIFLFLSCRKTSNDSTYFFKAKIDDKWVTYTDAHFFMNPDPSDPNMIDLQVYAGNYLNNINISMQSTAGIAPGQFNTDVSLPPYRMFINIFKDNGQYIQTYGSSTSGGGNQPYYTFTITSYNESEIRGTITGNYLYDGHDGVTINLTEGEFVARKAN